MRTQKFLEAFFPIENDPDESSLRIKHLRSGELTKITGKTHTQRFKIEIGEDDKIIPVPIIEADATKANELTCIEAVTGWENIDDADGEPMEYSLKNKAKFFNELSEENHAIVIAHIKKSRKILADQIAVAEAERLGKSSSGQSGLPA